MHSLLPDELLNLVRLAAPYVEFLLLLYLLSDVTLGYISWVYRLATDKELPAWVGKKRGACGYGSPLVSILALILVGFMVPRLGAQHFWVEFGLRPTLVGVTCLAGVVAPVILVACAALLVSRLPERAYLGGRGVHIFSPRENRIIAGNVVMLIGWIVWAFVSVHLELKWCLIMLAVGAFLIAFSVTFSSLIRPKESVFVPAFLLLLSMAACLDSRYGAQIKIFWVILSLLHAATMLAGAAIGGRVAVLRHRSDGAAPRLD